MDSATKLIFFDLDGTLIDGYEYIYQHLLEYFMAGAHEALTEIKQRGYKIFVVSGGIDLVVEAVFPDWRSLFEGVFINRYIFEESGNLTHAEPTQYNVEKKPTASRKQPRSTEPPLVIAFSSATISTTSKPLSPPVHQSLSMRRAKN